MKSAFHVDIIHIFITILHIDVLQQKCKYLHLHNETLKEKYDLFA